MNVYCKFCKQKKSINDCWCVINPGTKGKRYYECKSGCLQARTPITPLTTNIRETKEVIIPPKQSIFKRIFYSIFYRRSEYEKKRL